MGGVVYSTLRGEILPDDADDPMRTAIRQVMGVFAQLDRALIAKRMRNGRKAKALTGGYAGYGSPAYGQQAVNRELVDVPSEQQAIRTIQELRGLGMSYQAIATKLNDEGVKPKRGGVWYAMGVRRVLVRVS
jgi:DNA invertase Pin-like site-specific DNA recombinase